MIVEPASIHSRSPLRRLLRVTSFVAPVALLLVVIGAGLAGPKPAPRADATAASDDASAASTASPRAPMTAAPVPAGLAAAPDFPAAYASLPALRPSEALADRASPGGPAAVLAVTGFLGIGALPSRCSAPMITFGAWCERTGTLSETRLGPPGGTSAGRPPHLHATIPAGVILPVDVVASGAGGEDIPVVVVGRFAPAGSCAANPRSCDQGFVIERVVWADGATTDEQPLIEPGRDAFTALAPTTAADAVGATLVSVLARPATITRLDPVAGAVAERLRPRPALVWYVRELVDLDTPTPSIRWALFDPVQGGRLATGPSTVPVKAAAAQPNGSGTPQASPAG